MIRSKPATMTLVRSIGEPVRLSAEMVLTVVGVQGRQVRLKLSAPQGALVGAPVLVNAVVGHRLSVPVGSRLEEAERVLVQATLRACRGSKPRAAAMLGCSLKTLYNKLQRYAQNEAQGPTRATGALSPGRRTGPRAEEKEPVQIEP